MKAGVVIAFCALVVGAVVIVHYYRHAMVLERRFVAEFKVAEIQHDSIHFVRISGLCGHSSMSVYDIAEKRSDSSVTVLVYISLVLPGTNGYFHHDVQILDGVNEIRFGKSEAVIWRRDTVEE
jgi:hypothetical protein